MAIESRVLPASRVTSERGRVTTRRPARRRHAPWWFLVPGLACYAFVVLVPSMRGVAYAFTDWDGLAAVAHFVGLQNFQEILRSSDTREALRHTMLFAVSVTVVQNLFGLLLALGVNARIRTAGLLRVLLFAPVVMTPIVTGYLWRLLLGPDGPINGLFDSLHLTALSNDWLGDPKLALWSVAAVTVWQFAGMSMVVFLAGLQAIPPEVIEAAAVDGAGPMQRFWYVVRPMLAPAVTVNIMLTLIGGMKIFDQVFAMTGGGPGTASETLSTLVYKNAFTFGEFAYSAALAVVLTLLVAVLAAVQFKLLRRQERGVS